MESSLYKSKHIAFNSNSKKTSNEIILERNLIFYNSESKNERINKIDHPDASLVRFQTIESPGRRNHTHLEDNIFPLIEESSNFESNLFDEKSLTNISKKISPGNNCEDSIGANMKKNNNNKKSVFNIPDSEVIMKKKSLDYSSSSKIKSKNNSIKSELNPFESQESENIQKNNKNENKSSFSLKREKNFYEKFSEIQVKRRNSNRNDDKFINQNYSFGVEKSVSQNKAESPISNESKIISQKKKIKRNLNLKNQLL